MAAPATIVITNGLKFYDKLPWLFPHYPAMRDMFVNNPQLIQKTAAELYLSKSLHDTCGAGFGTGLRGDVSFCNAKLDEEFFAAGKCESCEREFPLNHVKSNFLCNIGYGDPAKVMPRGRRLDFSEACNLS